MGSYIYPKKVEELRGEREREDLFADLAEIIMIYMSTDCYAC